MPLCFGVHIRVMMVALGFVPGHFLRKDLRGLKQSGDCQFIHKLNLLPFYRQKYRLIQCFQHKGQI